MSGRNAVTVRSAPGACVDCGCEVYGVGRQAREGAHRLPGRCGDCARLASERRSADAHERRRARQIVRPSDVALGWPEPATHADFGRGLQRISLAPTALLCGCLRSRKYLQFHGQSATGRAVLLGLAREIQVRHGRGVSVASYALHQARRLMPTRCVACGQPGTRIVGTHCYCTAHGTAQRRLVQRLVLEPEASAKEAAIATVTRAIIKVEKHRQAGRSAGKGLQ